MTRVVLKIGRVATVAGDDEVCIPMSKLVRDDRGRKAVFQTEYSIRVTPIVNGRSGEPQKFACGLMRSEGR